MNSFIPLSGWGFTRKTRSVVDEINDIFFQGEEGRRSLYMFHYTNWQSDYSPIIDIDIPIQQIFIVLILCKALW